MAVPGFYFMMAELTRKQRFFLEAYLKTWNASEAARQAGYKYPDRQGYNLLRKIEIQACLHARLSEAVMQANEVLARLAEQAQLNAAEFFRFEVNPQTGQIEIVDVNWEVFKRRGHLVKGLRWVKGRPVVEFHDAQTALIQIGRALGLFTDRLDVNNVLEKIEVVLYLPENKRDGEED